MEVHHDEGVANRIDPESCAVAREGNCEALTGERIGQPLSRESLQMTEAEAVPQCRRQYRRRRHARRRHSVVVKDPITHKRNRSEPGSSRV